MSKTGDRRQERRVKEQERGERYLSPERDKGLPLDREETDVVHRQMVVYKGKKANPVLG